MIDAVDQPDAERARHAAQTADPSGLTSVLEHKVIAHIDRARPAPVRVHCVSDRAAGHRRLRAMGR
ncbi:MAG: hypothetical protein C0498_00080 [Anaerolinea sp.]|nr:hypothetical protein [Anaerolinea sp.]